jgi:hypothetical protein
MAETNQLEQIEHLLRQSPSVRQLGQNPFLLTLICWVGERQELSEQMTRTEIYGTVVRDLLGLARDGLGIGPRSYCRCCRRSPSSYSLRERAREV